MNTFSLSGRKLALAVDGGPESFLSADVTRRLVKLGASVRVAVTATTPRWLPDLTLATVSAAPVLRTAREGESLAKEVDGVLMMASGAELVAGVATGRPIDAAGSVFLCSNGPRLLSPGASMPMAPWVEALLGVLADDAVVMPVGQSPNQVVTAFARALGPRDLEGYRVLVTSGPTRESIDPVRFISNPSTGRMGNALADAAMRRGAEVTLLLGPTTLPPPPRVRTLRFQTVDELLGLALEAATDADVILAAAAVGDYAPCSPSTRKLKKDDDELRLVLRRTPDVLARLGDRFAGRPDRPILVGFAAETEDLLPNARRKLRQKKLDLVIANDVGSKEGGFESPNNEVTLVEASSEQALPMATKNEVAHSILDRVVLLLNRRLGGRSSQADQL